MATPRATSPHQRFLDENSPFSTVSQSDATSVASRVVAKDVVSASRTEEQVNDKSRGRFSALRVESLCVKDRPKPQAVGDGPATVKRWCVRISTGFIVSVELVEFVRHVSFVITSS